MKRSKSFATTAMLVGMLAAVAGQAPAPFKRTVLQQFDLSAPGREAVMAIAEIQPSAAAGRHTHPGEEIGYVLNGPVVIEIDGKPAKTYQTGDALMIPPNTIHNARNTGSSVVRILSTYVIEKGKPVATPVQ
ncbi:MAG TPA: cupin domain-containing protein [Vicinamibacterales bacterium]